MDYRRATLYLEDLAKLTLLAAEAILGRCGQEVPKDVIAFTFCVNKPDHYAKKNTMMHFQGGMGLLLHFFPPDKSMLV